jgi:hypothetical protein
MKRMLWIGMVAGLLAWGVTGCSDDDDKAPAGTVVVTTNVVNGVPVVETNVVAVAPPAANDEVQGAPVVETNVVNGTIVVITNWYLLPLGDAVRAAPQLVSPANKSVIAADSNGKARVDFRWTALPGVDTYLHRMGHYPGGTVFRGTSGSMEFSKGIYTWWIHGNYPTTPGRVEEGPASTKFVFAVQ